MIGGRSLRAQVIDEEMDAPIIRIPENKEADSLLVDLFRNGKKQFNVRIEPGVVGEWKLTVIDERTSFIIASLLLA